MTLHIRELIEIERNEIEILANRYGICCFAFDGCEDAKDPEIFHRFCDKNGKNCILFKDYHERILLNKED